MNSSLPIWGIAGVATAGVIARPFAWPEFIWAVAGALLLVVLGLLPAGAAWQGVLRGTDVYLFLIGMMLLAEVARAEGLFDWLAANAGRGARGSARRLFLLVYAVGIAVTVFLSNDATAVVLTPAVAAVARAARAEEPLPYLLSCALIANAASFVLPISNPANLVLYGNHVPPLLQWLPRFALPSAAAIGVTYAALRWAERGALARGISDTIVVPGLTAAGRIAAAGIVATGAILLLCSWKDVPLGLPTFLAGVETTLIVLCCARAGARELLGGISWGVLPLVAGLFVLVEALERTGLTLWLARVVRAAAAQAPAMSGWAAGLVAGFGCNLVNNLPAGLVAGRVAVAAPEQVRSALMIGIDLGPNLSVTGSLATILWLTALRREGFSVSAGRFLRVGVLVMPPALLAALAVR